MDTLFDFKSLMFCVYERRGEYSLALEQAEIALSAAKSQNRPSQMLPTMVAIGSVRLRLDDGDVEEYHREILKFAEENGLEERLAGAFHNWGSYRWQKGKPLDALALYERETPLRKREGPSQYASHLAFLARRAEHFQPERSLWCLQELIEIEAASPGTLSADILAETHYRLGALKSRLGMPPSNYLADALAAYEQYRRLPAMEVRVAWAAGLVASAYKTLGNADEASRFQDIKKEFLAKYGSKEDTVRVQLARLVSDHDLPEEEVRELELFARSDQGRAMYGDWVCAQGLRLLKSGSGQEALDLADAAIGQPRMSDEPRQDKDVAVLHHLRALCLTKLRRDLEALEDYERAVELHPMDKPLRFELCLCALTVGRLELAERHAVVISADDSSLTGPYQILARVSFSRNDLDQAHNHLLRGRKLARKPELLDREIKELVDIKCGLLRTSDSTIFKVCTPLSSVPSAPPPPGMAEYRRLSDFRRTLLDRLCDCIHELQKTPAVFIRNHRSQKTPLEEADFRDELERMLSATFRAIAGETNHGKGRADLVVVNATGNCVESVVLEFKVWGRNDYRVSVDQVMKYMTDLQVLGIIFMINENKTSIASKYREEIILTNPSYASGSFRISPIIQDSNLDHFVSRHRTPYGKEITVFHFIFNVN